MADVRANPLAIEEVVGYKVKIDKASSTITYIGKALPGSLTSSAVWQIMRLTYNASGELTDVEWADSDDQFDNVWDNRASLTYG